MISETKSSFFQDIHSEEPTVRNQSGPGRSEVSDESDNVTMEVEEEGEGNTTTEMSGISESEKEDKKSKPGPQTTKPEPAESVESKSPSASASAPSKPRLRTPCPYGKDCYRYFYLFTCHRKKSIQVLPEGFFFDVAHFSTKMRHALDLMSTREAKTWLRSVMLSALCLRDNPSVSPPVKTAQSLSFTCRA